MFLPDAMTALPVLVANPDTDLLIIDKNIPNAQILLTTVGGLSHVPPCIALRNNALVAPTGINTKLITIDESAADEIFVQELEKSVSWKKQDTPEFMKRKILIVDDVQDLLDMYSIVFTAKWYEVKTASNGLDGIAKASEWKPDIIFLDIMMPHMDGFEMMNVYKNNTSLGSVIVVNSNIDGTGAVEKIYESWADYYLRKSDFTPSQMASMIEYKLFDKKRDTSEPAPKQSFHPGKEFFEKIEK